MAVRCRARALGRSGGRVAHALGLLLATVGLYGVMSFLVAQRTREVGVRIALGAEAGHVIRRVVGRGLVLASLSSLLGLGVAARALDGGFLGMAPPASLQRWDNR